MSYDPPPKPKPRKPVEDPAALELARTQTIEQHSQELRRALQLGPAGQKRQLARVFGKRLKSFKKLLRQHRGRR